MQSSRDKATHLKENSIIENRTVDTAVAVLVISSLTRCHIKVLLYRFTMNFFKTKKRGKN